LTLYCKCGKEQLRESLRLPNTVDAAAEADSGIVTGWHCNLLMTERRWALREPFLGIWSLLAEDEQHKISDGAPGGKAAAAWQPAGGSARVERCVCGDSDGKIISGF
jgi:hypothetical protein